MTVKEIMMQAKGLTNRERAFLAQCLIASLESHQDDDVDQAWSELAEKRYQELISGKIAPVSWNEIKSQIKL